ncbi:MAG: 50S ribosomal protein L15 [Phycisphaerales bacterium]
MMIHEITEKVGKYKARKRIGRGHGSGSGKTAGRGHKGARSRAGFSQKVAREGGQLAYFRRFPKRGFSNFQFATTYSIVNVGQLDKAFDAGAEVDAKSLAKAGLVRDASKPVKILGEGELSKKLTVNAEKFSGSAKEKIEGAGGSTNEIRKTKWTRARAAASKKSSA